MNDEQIEYFKKIVKGNYTDDIINLFYKKYNIKLTCQNVKYYKRKYHISSGVNTKFKKGIEPHNKKELYSEFKDESTGYTYVKISEPNFWVQKQRYIYEKYYGKIPKGYSVVFLDQNKDNFDIENLMLIKDKDKLVAKNKKLFSSNKEVTKTGILVAKLINKNYEIMKGDK